MRQSIKYILTLLLLFLFCRGVSAQDTISKPSHYVVVYRGHDKNEQLPYCTAIYSNGKEEDLCSILNLCRDEKYDPYKYDLKLLDYFYKKNYELIAVNGNTTKYYFKQK